MRKIFNLIILMLIYTVICYSQEISYEYSENIKDENSIKGISFAANSLGILFDSPLYIGLGVSYKYLNNGISNHYISGYPFIGWNVGGMGGFEVSFEPMFNISNKQYDRFRTRINSKLVVLTWSFFIDYLYYQNNNINFGVSIGIGIPMPAIYYMDKKIYCIWVK